MGSASRLGLNKKIQKPSTRPTNLRGFCVEQVVNYLKSDYFLYSHLISSPSSSNSDNSLPLPTQDKNEIESGNKMKASEGLRDYLKSDSYMYSPLQKLTHPPFSPPKDRGKHVKLKKVSRSIVYTTMSTKELASP